MQLNKNIIKKFFLVKQILDMSVDTFIIIRNVHLERKNVLIVAKKVTSIRIAEK